MNLLILGASGFISRYVVKEAMNHGFDVWYVTRGNREGISGAHALIADRNDTDSLRRVLSELGKQFDAIIDCICFNPEQARFDLNTLSTYSNHLIVVSTDSVYHPDYKALPQTEDAPKFMEDQSYGGNKRAMEKVFLSESPAGVIWTLLRPPHMYGAGSELGCFPVHTRQKDLLEHLRNGKPIRLVGGGQYLIQPLYAGDIAKALVAAVGNPKTYNEIFCIAGPDAIPNRRYFEILGEILNLPVTFEDIDEGEYKASHDDSYLYLCHRAYDLGKLRDAGLPVPSVGLREGLTEQVSALLAIGR